MLSNLFVDANTNIISQIPVGADTNDDMLIWKFTPSGICTSKSAYQIFSPLFYGLNAGHNVTPSSSLTDQAKNTIRAILLYKEMPPRVQVFGWRLLRKTIPAGCRVAVRSTHIDQRCCRCGMNETDFHLFFSCHFVHAVWFASPPGLHVDGLIQQGIQEVEDAINHMLITFKTDHSVALIFNILWSIWKTRNNLLFDGKQCAPLQVLYAAKALLNAKELPQPRTEDTRNSTPTSQAINITNTTTSSLDRCWITKGPNIFTDAAWKDTPALSNSFSGLKSKAGLGVFMQWRNNDNKRAIFIKATSMAKSPL